jgi:uncharacterized membrane protein
MARKTRAMSHLPLPIRVIRARMRLLVSALIGLGFIVMFPPDWSLSARLVLGWDAGIGCYLAGSVWPVLHFDVGRIRERAALEDEGNTLILVLTSAATLASFGAIVALLGGEDQKSNGALLSLAAATIVLSWFFIHTIFAFHYAHEYYGERHAKKSGLSFEGTENPDYLDFIYFSFVIGMTFQVSDVATGSRSVRRTVLAHSIVAFFYNVALMALMVNIAASAI